MTSVMRLHPRMQEGDNLEHTNGKCQFVYTLVNLQTIVEHRHPPHNTIEHNSC